MLRIICILFILPSCLPAFSQYIATVNGQVDLKMADANRYATARHIIQENDYFLATYSSIPDASITQRLHSDGFEIISFVPPSSYICRKIKRDPKIRSLTDEFIGINQIPTQLKLSAPLYSLHQSNHINGSFILSAYRKEDLEKLTKWLDQQHIRHHRDKWTVGTDLIARIDNKEQFVQIAKHNLVAYISAYHGQPQPENNSTSMFCNQIYGLNYDRIGPTGRGTFFSNIEYFGSSSEFRINTSGRNHPVYGTNYPDNTETLGHSHGSQVSLYASATANVNEYEDRGMAEGATLIQMPGYDSIETYYTEYDLRPLSLNVSAGIGTSTVDYNNAAREFDRITRTLKGFLLCFSAGNDGHSENPHLNYGPGWANISSDDKTCKNNFTVHAAAQPGEHFDWACKGPTTDGRLKPDISAEGRFGTSFASPNLAGLINVLYESYQQSYNDIPRSDVIKAIILNTAVDADKRGIDFKTGFGTVNPVGAHRAITEKRIFTDIISQGNTDTREFQINVPAGLRELKVLLYWHDFEGTPGAAKALVNDLDLIITSPLGENFLPWTLDPTPGHQYDLPVRKKDDLNNVEQVTITDPEAGIYKILITGYDVPIGPQNFVITYEATPYQIEITSPAKDFRTSRGKTIMFTWNAAIDTLTSGNDIEILIEKEPGDVTSLATVPSTQLYYNYTLPQDFPFSSTARIVVRQKNTLIADTSEYFHVMQTPSSFRMTGVCDDRISFAWNDVSVTDSKYIIYKLGEKYMEPVSTVHHPVTSVTIDADTILPAGQKFGKEDWFAIAAQHPNGALSLRSNIISTQQTNLLNEGTHIGKNIQLCFGDSAIVQALDLVRDSIRWFLDDQIIADADDLSYHIKGSSPGTYYYKIFQPNGCVFGSDTFYVSSPLAITDTLAYGPKIWNVFAFRNHDPQQYYGRMPMRKLSINSLEYYTEFEQIDNAAEYTGCDPGFIYTILYKRAGFTKGYYKFDLKHIQESMKLYIDGELVYTSPANAVNQGIIWEGILDENSKVRIEHIVRGRALMNLDISVANEIKPAGIESDLLLWLKGNDVVTNENNRVSHWLDSYALSYQNAADPASDITYEEGGLNYHDILSFHGKSGIFGKFPSLNFGDDATTFAVFKMESSSDQNARVIGFGLPPYYQDDNYFGTYAPFYRNGSTSQIGMYRDSTGLFPSEDQTDRWQLMSVDITDTEHIISLFGKEMVSAEHDFNGLLYQTFNIGCRPDTSADEGELTGSIAEVLHFQRSLLPSETDRINSYLALKYGLTLDRAYVSRQGLTIYDPGNFGFGIAGLAREDQSGWIQKQAKTIDADIFIGSVGPIVLTHELNVNNYPDTTYVVWGHDIQAPEFLIYVNDSTSRLTRTYKLQHTGESTDFRFNFYDEGGLFNIQDNKYDVLLSEDPVDFSSAVSHRLDTYTAADGKTYLFTDVILNGSNTLYFTLQQTRDSTITVSSGDLLTSPVHVYPNPFSDQISVEGTHPGDVIEIYDGVGRKMHTLTAYKSDTMIQCVLEPGYYLLTVTRSGKEVCRKVMVRA